MSGSGRYQLSYEVQKTGSSTAEVKEAVERAGRIREDVEKELDGKT